MFVLCSVSDTSEIVAPLYREGSVTPEIEIVDSISIVGFAKDHREFLKRKTISSVCFAARYQATRQMLV